MFCSACMAGVVFRLRLRLLQMLNSAVFSCFPLLCSAMDPPSFCAHDDSLFVNIIWAVKREWWTSYDASRKLARVKAKDVGITRQLVVPMCMMLTIGPSRFWSA